MAAIALIGPDGAGKTTITRMLQESGATSFKYLYMGVDIPASNLALPTSRWVERLKSRPESAGPADTGTRPHHPGPGRRGGGLRGFARLGNRLAEEWFRQLVSWVHQARGFTVLYDRHFVFDFAPEIAGGDEPVDRRIHRWCLMHFYPRPDMVIFLDAPGALLFARKGESTIAELERRRQGFLRLGQRTPGFVRVDATRALPEVYAEVAAHITRLGRQQRAARKAVR